MPLDTAEKLRIITAEVFLHRTFVVSTFVLVSFVSLVVGFNWPEVYRSSTTVFIEEDDILVPLTSGIAVQTQNIDRARIARDVIYGRKIMDQVIDALGWSNSDPAEMERLRKVIKEHTKISEAGKRVSNLITIEYEDSDPDRTFLVTKTLASAFISGSLALELEESESAYDFINEQVEQYEKKLKNTEAQIKTFKEENADISTETESQIASRLTELRSREESLRQDLREAEIRRNSLEKQLSGEAQLAETHTRAGQQRQRIAELQAELDALSLIYHETYPDVVRIRDQIDELRNAISKEEQKRQEERRAAKDKGGIYLDEAALENPIYQELLREFYQTNTNIRTMEARIDQVNRLLQENVELAKRTKGASDILAALMRDHEVTRNIYDDFSRRRETARVSLQIDREKKGLNLKIEEPAFFPHQPSGPPSWQIILGGVLLAFAVPVGMISARCMFDPKVRSEISIPEEIGLPVLGVIKHFDRPRELWLKRIWSIILLVIVLATLATMATTSYFMQDDIVPPWMQVFTIPR